MKCRFVGVLVWECFGMGVFWYGSVLVWECFGMGVFWYGSVLVWECAGEKRGFWRKWLCFAVIFE